MMMKALGRIILVPVAFILAGAAALAIIATLGLELVTGALHSAGDETRALTIILDFVTQGVGLAAAATLIPALAVVIVGEVARIRSPLYYVLGGGAALAVIPLLSHATMASADGTPGVPTVLWTVLATGGFAGGFIYWLLAGRQA